jgi:hypothetical protein
MEFFVPECETAADAEAVWQGTRESVRRTLEWIIGERRIFAIKYLAAGEEVTATVGQPEPTTGEQVQVILDAESFLVCTENHGVMRGMPILVASPLGVTEFDET